MRPSDNLCTASLLALDPRTGAIEWHYQFTPNDPFDYDGTDELVLAGLTVDGIERCVVMQANRSGFLHVLDRETGELLAANKLVDRVGWAISINLGTGRPVENPIAAARAGEQIEVWPSALGGKNWLPMSFHPGLGLVFANTLTIGMTYKAIEPAYWAGTIYFGVEFSWTAPEEGRGALRAMDPLTGKSRWSQPTDIPRWAAVLAKAPARAGDWSIARSRRADGRLGTGCSSGPAGAHAQTYPNAGGKRTTTIAAQRA
ncbi:PQQ-binding-like beta-propeller repeat protein [Rubellimicrobium mesophilum]|uniref:outer membrane protein assembly factor BamB family protein n=1 Tax=Rubellimicrobium mesophilum TaxID=1123067 RepID=UPI0006870FD7|nr:PQQ-binding-like beta-propeller repeat protein [Rubellimicrobium mesophilum]